MKYTKKSEKIIPRICAVCGKVIDINPDYIRTRRGTELYFHRACMRRGQR